jgi:4-hydroxy-tetrahydrodipicolinate reductase
MTRIGIIGAGGRMGRAIAALLEGGTAAGAKLAGGAGRGDDPVELAQGSDVLIDFSTPGALEASLAAASGASVPIVVGTTGLGPDHHRLIDQAAARTAVLQSANMSLGVNLIAHLVREAAARLGPEWDIEVVEMHHRHKADAPSGTALLLGTAAAQGRGVDLATVSDRGRDGMTGPRKEGDIGFAVLRGGSVAGDHEVVFAGEGERIAIGHRAESRAIFAQGALKAALWIAGRPAGRYSMNDVLGL